MAKEKRYFVFFTDLVTTVKNGIMTAADKRKLDGIAEKANNYTHPKSGVAAGTYKSVAVDANGHVTSGSNPTTLSGYGITDAAAKDHTHETIGGHKVEADVPANAKFTDTTYSNATQSASGLFSAADKRKLDGIAENAKNITVDAALSKTSANPVQNKAIATELEAIKKSGSDGKTSVAGAVTAMGVPTATDADFDTIAANIKKISTGVDTTDATATAGAILAGQTAYVNGAKIVGNIASKAVQIYTPGTANQEIAAGQYLAGIQTIKGDSNLVANNIKKDVSIFGIAGSFNGLNSGGYAAKNVVDIPLEHTYSCYGNDYNKKQIPFDPHILILTSQPLYNCAEFRMGEVIYSYFDLYHRFYFSPQRIQLLSYYNAASFENAGAIPEEQINNKQLIGGSDISINMGGLIYDWNCIKIYDDGRVRVYPYMTKDGGDLSNTDYDKNLIVYVRAIELDVA